MILLHLRRFAEALLAGLLAGAVLLILAPLFLGWRPYTVLTGSMRPGIQPGDVVMDRPVAVRAAHVGDVVTFSDPTRRGVLVTHRIRSIQHGPVQTQVETRGDANNASERWTIATEDRLGKVVYVLPKIGLVATVIRNPIGIVLLVVLPILLIGAGLLRKIWMDDDEDEDAGGGAGPPPGAEATQASPPGPAPVCPGEPSTGQGARPTGSPEAVGAPLPDAGAREAAVVGADR